MTTTFQSVNVALNIRDFSNEATTPTTPRAPITTSAHQPSVQPSETSTPVTPTRWSFSGMNGQRPLPTSPFSNSFSSQPAASETRPDVLNRGDSHLSHRSMPSVSSIESQDVDMDESDEGEGGSDGESADGETERSSKKKKGQRFFCTEFPPCNLSFTRSEHLARHIRKHTGERPFQCHCSRRFSRLDNLRQHAQTVHVNEEIPGDSLAATGTRFQRQIRTDRVRTPNGRSRASTASSQGSHHRGHSRNLSASSIGSTSSTISRDDGRRRPPPLMMASDSNSRARLSIDTQPTTPPGIRGHSREPSGDITTPTSSTFSNGPNSPAFGSAYGSPISAASRTASMWGGRTQTPIHSRRLSVPSAGNLFQPAHGSTYPPPYLSPLASSNASPSSSIYGSPTNSNYSFSRGDAALTAEADSRRRTWHPSSYSSYPRPATSGLSYYQTPDAPRPAFAPKAIAAMGQPQRLPGIETFDHPSTAASPNRGPSPMQVDTSSKPPIYPGPVQSSSGPNDRRGHASWDMSLHRNLTKLDLANGTPPKENGIWAQQAIIEDPAHVRPQHQSFPAVQAPQVVIHQETPPPNIETSFLQPATPNRKRMGWYAGPPPASQQPSIQQRRSPEDSSSSEGVATPSFSVAEYHPSIVHSNGYIETHHASAMANHHVSILVSVFSSSLIKNAQTYQATNPQVASWPLPAESIGTGGAQAHSQKDTAMSGLDALVAVATSEDKVPSGPTR